MEATPDPSPDDASKPQDPRLVPFFAVRKRVKLRLTREARASGLDPTTCVWAVDEVLERLSVRYLRKDPPDSDVAWSVQVLKNLFTEIRESPDCCPLEGDCVDDRDRQGDTRIPGLHDFWGWVDAHSQVLESCCTPLEWSAFLATKDAPLIEGAANCCEQTPLNYRNLIDRLGGKVFWLISQGRVPPPPLKGQDEGEACG